ncbi:MAG: hypothetical protein KAT90_00855, partial [Gammaproteobacteria bacterium]|nr:hypothetical protein [Gammaproteobacteria bacterium]
DDKKETGNTEAETTEATVNNSALTMDTENNLISNPSYPLQAHRRMRSKELHYIDHPLIGILIQINPVKKPKK